DTSESDNKLESEASPAESGEGLKEQSDPDETQTELVAAASQLLESVGMCLASGYQRTSVVLLGQLLQAAHHARANGLHWPAAAALRVYEGVRRLRTESKDADEESLRRDMLTLITSAHMIENQTAGWTSRVGTARRKYEPYPQAMRLDGVFAEPILTDSGYAGMVVYLISDSGDWFTVSDVRLGGAERLQNVWKGGIAIGKQTVPAAELIGCRMLIRGGASADGRLGLGQKSEMALSHREDLKSESVSKWLDTDFATQMNRVFANQQIPDLARPANWDLVGLRVEVLGAQGVYLIVRRTGDGVVMPFGIWSEDDNLEYRRNLQRLAAVPGMLLNVVARFDFSRPDCLFPLAIAPCDVAPETETSHDNTDSDAAQGKLPRPELRIPESQTGCWSLGWQRLQPDNFSRTEPPVVLDPQEKRLVEFDRQPLARRLAAMLQGGHRVIPDASSDHLQIESATYLEAWQVTAASILMELSTASAMIRAAETRTETREAIKRLTELWVAGEIWSQTQRMMSASEHWLSPDGTTAVD
ncbi:MAG: hypothetical protein AAF497_26905, partial [Planctomycetota bacterium]